MGLGLTPFLYCLTIYPVVFGMSADKAHIEETYRELVACCESNKKQNEQIYSR